MRNPAPNSAVGAPQPPVSAAIISRGAKEGTLKNDRAAAVDAPSLNSTEG